MKGIGCGAQQAIGVQAKKTGLMLDAPCINKSERTDGDVFTEEVKLRFARVRK